MVFHGTALYSASSNVLLKLTFIETVKHFVSILKWNEVDFIIHLRMVHEQVESAGSHPSDDLRFGLAQTSPPEDMALRVREFSVVAEMLLFSGQYLDIVSQAQFFDLHLFRGTHCFSHGCEVLQGNI